MLSYVIYFCISFYCFCPELIPCETVLLGLFCNVRSACVRKMVFGESVDPFVTYSNTVLICTCGLQEEEWLFLFTLFGPILWFRTWKRKKKQQKFYLFAS